MKRHIGEIYYVVEETLNSFRKKKLFCTDSEGNQWYRYDKPNRSYEIKKYEVVGKLEKILSGDFDRTDIMFTDTDTEYFVRNEDGNIEDWCEGDFELSTVFLSEANAIAKKHQLETFEKENNMKDCEEVVNVKIVSRSN